MSPFSTACTAAAVLAAVLFAPPARAAEPAAAGPVERFRSALLQPLGPGGAKDRKAELLKRLDALETLGLLAGALHLEFWAAARNTFPRSEQDKLVIEGDQEILRLLMGRFMKRIREALSADDPAARAAAATFVETTASLEGKVSEANPWGQRGAFPAPGSGQAPATAAGALNDLAPDFVRLTKDDDALVRRAALRALAEVSSDRPATVAVLGRLLSGDQKDKDPSVRRAAAAALGGLLETAALEDKRSLGLDPEARAAFIRLMTLSVPQAAAGLADDEAEVRRLCLVALRRTPDALKDLTEFVWSGPADNANPEVQAMMQSALKRAREEAVMLRTLADALNQRLAAVNDTLADAPEVAVAASELLEAVAVARSQLRRWEAALPPDKADAAPSADPLPALLDARAPLAKNLSAKEVRVRLAAVYVLESLGAEAAPDRDALAKALVGDADPFVRWGAARALGKMAPDEPGAAVPALGRALEDKNEDVRLTAAAALGRFGPAAKGAVAALAAAVKRDDGARLESLKALAAVGAAAAPAAGESAAALTDPAAEVRVAAANALARMGPLDAVPRGALRGALNDPDDAVRRAAAGALLSGK